MKQEFVIQLNFANPKPVTKYLGEQNNCNRPLKLAKRFTKLEAEKMVSSSILSNLNPKIVAA